MRIEDDSASHALENYFDSLLSEENESNSSNLHAEKEPALRQIKVSVTQKNSDNKKNKYQKEEISKSDRPVSENLTVVSSLDAQQQTKTKGVPERHVDKSDDVVSTPELKKPSDVKPVETSPIPPQSDALKSERIANKEIKNTALSNSPAWDDTPIKDESELKHPTHIKYSKTQKLDDTLKFSPNASESKPKMQGLIYDDPKAHALEEEKKVRLQRLLDQQIKMETEQVPSISPVVSPKVVSPKVVSPKVDTPKIITATPQEVEIKPNVKLDDNTKVKTFDADVALDKPTRELEILAWGENGRPMWAEKEFDILLFNVCGLSLAVPLAALGQIFPYKHEKLSFLQGQSEWFMGILPTSLADIRCINTALFVMPEKYNDSFLKNANYVVTINGFHWGLVVDNVKQPISLQPDEVNWRKQRSKRPWLAGTVKSHMCALIDIPQMAQILEHANRKASD